MTPKEKQLLARQKRLQGSPERRVSDDDSPKLVKKAQKDQTLEDYFILSLKPALDFIFSIDPAHRSRSKIWRFFKGYMKEKGHWKNNRKE